MAPSYVSPPAPDPPRTRRATGWRAGAGADANATPRCRAARRRADSVTSADVRTSTPSAVATPWQTRCTFPRARRSGKEARSDGEGDGGRRRVFRPEAHGVDPAWRRPSGRLAQRRRNARGPDAGRAPRRAAARHHHAPPQRLRDLEVAAARLAHAHDAGGARVVEEPGERPRVGQEAGRRRVSLETVHVGPIAERGEPVCPLTTPSSLSLRRRPTGRRRLPPNSRPTRACPARTGAARAWSPWAAARSPWTFARRAR